MRIHPSIVAHEGGRARIVVQIDTQQLSSGGTAEGMRSPGAGGDATICVMGAVGRGGSVGLGERSDRGVQSSLTVRGGK
jgi:hypothetical protein